MNENPTTSREALARELSQLRDAVRQLQSQVRQQSSEIANLKRRISSLECVGEV